MNPASGIKSQFRNLLLTWHKTDNHRHMPWKGVRDPYKIWLSEIILQQTRVEQGMGYYNRFLSAYPDIQSLANAPESEVFKLWEGLGYYSRCRNLMTTARIITEKYGGHFPPDHGSILSLKGVGPYTAAAIASFAFDLPHAVVDGNVFRVLARVFGIADGIDTTTGKRNFTALANELIDRGQPGQYNQAIMDFGATVCKPVNPLCDQCVFKKDCNALLTGRINELPVKTKKTKIRKRWFNYMVLHHEGKVAITRRIEKDIWRDLWEFPLIETSLKAESPQLLKEAEVRYGIARNRYQLEGIKNARQQLSHQLINGQFLHITLSEKPPGNELRWIPMEDLEKETFPVLINSYIQSGNSAPAPSKGQSLIF